MEKLKRHGNIEKKWKKQKRKHGDKTKTWRHWKTKTSKTWLSRSHVAKVEIGNRSRGSIGEEPIAALKEEIGIAMRNRRGKVKRILGGGEWRIWWAEPSERGTAVNDWWPVDRMIDWWLTEDQQDRAIEWPSGWLNRVNEWGEKPIAAAQKELGIAMKIGKGPKPELNENLVGRMDWYDFFFLCRAARVNGGMNRSGVTWFRFVAKRSGKAE
jgi:hypothetical protein